LKAKQHGIGGYLLAALPLPVGNNRFHSPSY